MFRNKTVYEAKLGEQFYQFICEPTAAVDSVIAVLECILRDAKQYKESVEKSKEDEIKSDEIEVKE